MNKRVVPPKSWMRPEKHLETVLSSPWYRHLAVLISEISFATQMFYRERGLRSVFLPVTTGSISSPMGAGSDSLPVRITLGNQEVYLADSMQFLLEFALRLTGQGVYYIMPSFRGEQVDSCHLCQFYHSEVEVLGGLDKIMRLAEEYVRALSVHILGSCPEDVIATAGDCAHVERVVSLDRPFPHIRLNEAVRMLADQPGCVSMDNQGVAVITRVGERELIHKFGDFVWLTHMHKLSVPFYQAVESDTHSSLTADLLAGTGELLGSGQRIGEEDELRKSLRLHKVGEEEYRWYLEMKRLFPAKTAGFGMGIERFLLWLTRTDDIRDCVLLLRNHDCNHYP